MKKYKLILNIGQNDETILYFERLTTQKIDLLKNCISYVLMYYDNFFKKYIKFDFKANKEEQIIFNDNLDIYTH